MTWFLLCLSLWHRVSGTLSSFLWVAQLLSKDVTCTIFYVWESELHTCCVSNWKAQIHGVTSAWYMSACASCVLGIVTWSCTAATGRHWCRLNNSAWLLWNVLLSVQDLQDVALYPFCCALNASSSAHIACWSIVQYIPFDINERCSMDFEKWCYSSTWQIGAKCTDRGVIPSIMKWLSSQKSEVILYSVCKG